MAQRTIVTMTDDLDGSEAVETVAFGLDGQTYEIDLNAVNAQELRDALAPYVSVARRAGGKARQRQPKAATSGQGRKDSDAVDPKAVREWAEANGVQVSSRGRIAASVVEQYGTAQKPEE